MSNNIVSELDLDGSLANRWRISLTKQLKWYLTVCQEQNMIVEAFVKRHMDFVVLKGTSAAVYYPIPEYRKMGDVDIIVAPQDFEQAKEVFEELKYDVIMDIDRHISFKKYEVEFELHRFFAEMKDTCASDKADNRIFRMLHHPQWITLMIRNFQHYQMLKMDWHYCYI